MEVARLRAGLTIVLEDLEQLPDVVGQLGDVLLGSRVTRTASGTVLDHADLHVQMMQVPLQA